MEDIEQKEDKNGENDDEAPDLRGDQMEREDDDFPGVEKEDEERKDREHVEDSEINDKIKKAEELLKANESPVTSTSKLPDQSKAPVVERAMAEEQSQDQTELEGAPAGKGASFSFGKQQPGKAAMASQPADGMKQTSDSIARDPNNDLMNT